MLVPLNFVMAVDIVYIEIISYCFVALLYPNIRMPCTGLPKTSILGVMPRPGAVLATLAWPARQSAALRAQRAAVEEYFSNNVHRMEYPEYQAEGWHIGSGVVESACKTVVGQRLKGAGMRWGEDGAHALCHLRALYRSEKGQWEAFWSRDGTHN